MPFSALGDIAFLTGMERNSDIVVMETYAPLLVDVNPGGWQWGHPNLIGDYAQVMFAENKGTVCLPTTITSGPRLVSGVTRDAKSKRLYIKIVNPSAKPHPVALNLKGFGAVAPTGEAVVLTSSDRDAVNTIDDPTRVVPRTVPLRDPGQKFLHTLPRIPLQFFVSTRNSF